MLSPVAADRLHVTTDGRVRVSLRAPWQDGTILYYGILGARASRRAEMVCPGGMDASVAEPARVGGAAAADSDEGTSRADGRGWRWAALMRRTFDFDVLLCPRCGGRMRLISLIEDADVIGRILRHLGLRDTIPSPRPARAPPATMAAPGRNDEFRLA